MFLYTLSSLYHHQHSMYITMEISIYIASCWRMCPEAGNCEWVKCFHYCLRKTILFSDLALAHLQRHDPYVLLQVNCINIQSTGVHNTKHSLQLLISYAKLAVHIDDMTSEKSRVLKVNCLRQLLSVWLIGNKMTLVTLTFTVITGYMQHQVLVLLITII